MLLVTCAATVARAEETPAEAAYREGSEALRARNLPAAIAAFERAVEFEPERVEAWFKLGIACSGNGDAGAAAEAYGRVIELDPQHAKALNNLANVHFRRGDYEAAGEWYSRALAVDPGYLLAAYHHGRVLRQLNRPDEAEPAFAHCLELDAANERERQTQLDCRFYLGSLRFRAGDYAQAAVIMEQVIAAHRSHLEARYYLGMAYRRLGRIDDARTQLEIHRQMLEQKRKSEPIARQSD